MKRRTFVIGSAAAVAAGAIGFGRYWSNASSAYESRAMALRSPLPPRADAHALVRYATLAPNGHNTQPWRFAIAPDRIVIRPDFTRRTPVVDPDDHHVYVSLGCAAENLAIAAGASGRRGDLHFDAVGDGAIIFADTGDAGAVDHDEAQAALFSAIPKRQSTRADYDSREISAADLAVLAAAAAAVPDADTILITEGAQRIRLHELIIAGNTAQMNDAAFVRELKAWVRFSPAQMLQSGDGLYSATTGNPTMPAWLGSLAFDATVSAASTNETCARQLASSSGFAVFVGAHDDAAHWALAGRACQRFALQATALGMKHAFVNQPVEVAALRPELAALVGLSGRRPNIVMRFGFGPTMPYAIRRPIEAVIDA